MATFPIKITQLTKDFDMKSKDVLDTLKDIGIDKKSGGSLDNDEFELFVAHVTFTKQIKDVERIYIMATPSWFEQGQYQVNLNRPLQKQILEQASMVESYGVAYIGGDGKNYTRVGDGDDAREYQIGTSQLTRGALDVFGFNPVVGAFDGIDRRAKRFSD